MNFIGLLLMLLIACAVVISLCVLIQWFRHRRAVRASNVSADSPGCTKCLYIVRGWNSAMCPECGTNAAYHGVVIGVRVSRWLKTTAVFVIVAAALLPVTTWFAEWAMRFESRFAAWQFASVAEPRYLAHLSTRQDIHTRWGTPRLTTRIVLSPPDSMDGLMIAYQVGDGTGWQGAQATEAADDSAWFTLQIGPSEDVPTAGQLASHIAGHLRSAVTPEIKAQAEALAAHVAASRSGRPMAATFTPDPAMFGNVSAGYGTSRSVLPAGFIGMLAVPAVAAFLAAVLAFKRHRPGWRAAREGEWLANTPLADSHDSKNAQAPAHVAW